MHFIDGGFHASDRCRWHPVSEVEYMSDGAGCSMMLRTRRVAWGACVWDRDCLADITQHSACMLHFDPIDGVRLKFLEPGQKWGGVFGKEDAWRT